jgi:hypothetical protein
VLLIGAALLLASLLHLRRADLGLRSDHVLTASLSLPDATYRRYSQVLGFYEELRRRVSALPGVRAVGLSESLAPTGSRWSGVAAVAGGAGGCGFHHRLIDDGYLAALQVPLLQGRSFAPRRWPAAPRRRARRAGRPAGAPAFRRGAGQPALRA